MHRSRCVKRTLRAQHGYILLPVVLLIALVAVVAFLLNNESALDSGITESVAESAEAEYVAQAGLQHALQHIRRSGCGPYTDITNVVLGDHSYSTTLTTNLGATSSYTLNVDQDTWIRSDQPTDNNATDALLSIRFESGKIERPLYRFDLSSLPANAAVLSATVWFYAKRQHPEGPANIHALTATWTETDATWNSMSGNMDSTVLASIPAQLSDNTWVSADLTAQVQAWVNGQPNFGIALDTVSEGVITEYHSREENNKEPYLVVMVGNPATSASLQATGTLANGVSRGIKRDDVVLYQYPSGVLQLQPDAVEGEDAEIWDQAPNNNYGNAAETWVSSASNDTTRSLLRFNMGAIPFGARILEATLSLQRRSGSGADQPVSAHRIRNWWSEGSVTWNRRDTGINWDTAGGDFDTMAVATTPVGPVNQRYAWNISPLVQGWVDGSYPNYGVILVAAIAGMPGERFYTSDESQLDRRPSLSVTYACTCGTACLAPQGSGRVAMVGNYIGSWPDPADLEKEAIIESWGYDVDIYDDEFVWWIDPGNYDVVYVSETASSNTVGTQLTGLSIGVVNEQGNLNDELELANGKNTAVGAEIDITDNSHYITQPFAQGLLPIYTADMELLTTNTPEAPGLQRLAEVSGAGSLVALDAGMPDTGGGTSAGRRVTLPLGRSTNTDFNWTHLNNNGRLIVQRAIAWGMSADIVNIGNLLMVVVNDGNLTTQEDAKKLQLESWGYNVTVIDQDDSQGAFDTAVSTNIVVFIGEDVSSGAVGTKLVNAPIGVVTEEDNLSDEFGLSDSIHWGSGTTLTITNNTHYITNPFALGNLPVLNTSESLADITGSQAPALQLLGSTTDGPALIALETGSTLVGGGTAAGRRVQLPWGGNNMQLGYLTDDGLTIFRRALEWGAGLDLSLSSPIAHWQLDETSGTIADDAVGANDGTLINGPVWTPGLFNGGLEFDGSNDRVDAGTFDVNGSGITMLGWFNADTIAANDPRIISKANSTSESGAWWQLSMSDSGSNRYLRMRIKAGGTTTTFADSTVNLLPGQWYFAAGTYDAATGDMKLYLDGVEIASGSHAVGGAVDTDPSVSVEIGANGTAERFFDGVLDDVRVYDRALSAAEIDELAAPPSAQPIAHWKLDETSGTTAVDSEGGNDGTLNNGPVWTPGTIDGGLDFDGSNDYVSTNSSFMPPPAGTVSFWMQVDGSPGAHGRILGLHDTWEVRHVTTGTANGIPYGLVFDLGVSGVNTEFVTTTTVDVPGKWYHIVASYDTATDDYAVYIDGVPHKSGTYSSGLSVPSANTLSLGTRTGSANYYDGMLDDVRIYDTVLTPAEIADLAAQGGGGGGGGSPTIVEVRVATGNDDAEERVSNGNVNLTSSDLELISDGSNAQLVGMRFTGVAVPNGATISNAWIQFQVDETNSGATNVNIQGEAIDSAPQFTTGNSNISSRSRTVASIPWAPVPWTTVGEAGPDQQTPDISALIQEIVDRPGWASGNDMVMIITGSGERTTESYNGDASGAALLHIEYY